MCDRLDQAHLSSSLRVLQKGGGGGGGGGLVSGTVHERKK